MLLNEIGVGNRTHLLLLHSLSSSLCLVTGAFALEVGVVLPRLLQALLPENEQRIEENPIISCPTKVLPIEI